MSVWNVAGHIPNLRGSGYRRAVGFVALAAMIAGLSGCKVFVRDEPPTCPRVSILADAASVTQFAAGGPETPANLVVQAKMTDYHGACRLDTVNHLMQLTLSLTVDAVRGPKLTGDQVDLQYFLALPTFYPNGKKIMPITLHFPAGVNEIRYTDDNVYVEFPVEDTPGTDALPGTVVKDLAKYESFFGWQLDAAELAYNRKNSAH